MRKRERRRPWPEYWHPSHRARPFRRRRDYQGPTTLFLDNDYDIAPDSFVVIQKQMEGRVLSIITKPLALSASLSSAYGFTGKTN